MNCGLLLVHPNGNRDPIAVLGWGVTYLTPDPSPEAGEGSPNSLESPSPLGGEGFRVR